VDAHGKQDIGCDGKGQFRTYNDAFVTVAFRRSRLGGVLSTSMRFESRNPVELIHS
jgi:hypothetical protein